MGFGLCPPCLLHMFLIWFFQYFLGVLQMIGSGTGAILAEISVVVMHLHVFFYIINKKSTFSSFYI